MGGHQHFLGDKTLEIVELTHGHHAGIGEGATQRIIGVANTTLNPGGFVEQDAVDFRRNRGDVSGAVPRWIEYLHRLARCDTDDLVQAISFGVDVERILGSQNAAQYQFAWRDNRLGAREVRACQRRLDQLVARGVRSRQ